jgi:hypothetical protein
MNIYPKIIARFYKDGGLQKLEEKKMTTMLNYSFDSHIDPNIGEVITMYANNEDAMKVAKIQTFYTAVVLGVVPREPNEYVRQTNEHTTKTISTNEKINDMFNFEH